MFFLRQRLRRRMSRGMLFFSLIVLQLATTKELISLLSFFQVVLPVFYSFFIPCISVFALECSCRHRSSEAVTNFRRKLSTILVGSWVHWYMHWELWSWFWSCLAFYFTIFCHDMPPRFYEYSVGLGTTSVMVCLVSNLLSDYRIRLKTGTVRILFNVSCCFLMSWLLRFAYPCFFNIGVLDEFDIFWDDSEDPLGYSQGYPRPPSPPPPEYSEVQQQQRAEDMILPPPTYAETLARIRAQLPKLQRSISLQAQRLGRSLSHKGTSGGGAAGRHPPPSSSGEESNKVPASSSSRTLQKAKKQMSSDV